MSVITGRGKWAIATFAFSLSVSAWSQAQAIQPDVMLLAQANPEVVINQTPYAISGSTAAELRQQMNRLGPFDAKAGRRFDAYTKWNVRWNYRYRNQGDRCQITSATVRTTVTITLPQWNPPRNASRDLRDRWNRYIRALTLHENGHRDHGIAAGRDIVPLLQTFPAQPTCAELETKANAAAHQMIRNYSQQDVDYDRTTRHGATQGALFP